MQFSREDWTIFRNLNTLTHKAGVPLKDIRALVLKEVMDNALDAAPGKKPKYGEDEMGYCFIEDEGPGISGGAETIARLFSIRRPLTSSKILRVPSRGALGNGIRVICGAVLASGGKMYVETQGMAYFLELHDDGTTTVRTTEKSKVQGTRINLKFGDSLPRSSNDWRFAEQAARMNFALTYKGQSSVWWYDSDAFYELLIAAGDARLIDVLTLFDGWTKKRKALTGAKEIYVEGPCSSVTREQADKILGYMRMHSEEISPKKIGRMIDKKESANSGDGTMGYARKEGCLTIEPGRGKYPAQLPFMVEVLAVPRDSEDEILAMVNGTPITGKMQIERREAGVAIFGCGLHHKFDRVSKKPFRMLLNVTIPYMPITTDGKEPDFGRFTSETLEAMRGATRKLRSATTKAQGSQQSTILDRYIDRAVRKASGDGQYRFSLRQLYYALRPYVMERAESGNLDYGYFSRWVGAYENEHGEIPGMYRDPRGTLYHPHTGETIPIGTVAVEQYKRPEWTFNKVLYIEKEGLFEVLKQVGFPERYDCALLSSKGFASRAVKDLIDLLGEDGEEVHVFALHDADGPGTVIYESLVEGTLGRAARRVKVHNLGLEPWEGVEMGLQVESFPQRKQRTPVAKYITRMWGEEGGKSGMDWDFWLQENRIELNAMTSPQFVEWLEAKFKEIEVRKIVPPSEVLRDHLKAATKKQVEQSLLAEIMRKARFEEKVQERMKYLESEEIDRLVSGLEEMVRSGLEKDPAQKWTGPVEKLAAAVAEME